MIGNLIEISVGARKAGQRPARHFATRRRQWLVCLDLMDSIIELMDGGKAWVSKENILKTSMERAAIRNITQKEVRMGMLPKFSKILSIL